MSLTTRGRRYDPQGSIGQIPGVCGHCRACGKRWNGSKQAARADFALSDRLKAELRMLLDKDIQNIFITDSDARHIKKNHGQGETLRGQVDITPADFALIPFVMNEFDDAELVDADNRGNRRILFTKRVNGNVYSVSVEMGNSQIGVITLWKKARSGASC